MRHPPPLPVLVLLLPVTPPLSSPSPEQQECGIVPALTPRCCASAARCRCRRRRFFLRELWELVPCRCHTDEEAAICVHRSGVFLTLASPPLSRFFFVCLFVPSSAEKFAGRHNTQLEAAAADGPELTLPTRTDRTYPTRSGNM